MKQETIELPDDLAERVDNYLKEHPGETLSSLIQEVLEIKVSRKDISKLLELSGIVSDAPSHATNYAEDQL
jgi:metal-responsive CopG/Arc/MetJ family transcriptional regulator